jgi:RecB family endonuclease NucS
LSDIQLFRLADGTAVELSVQAVKLEKQLQGLIETNMLTFLGVRFLASEFATGKTRRGRIDSLGLDENGCPVIIEYKRDSKENVINQGLFYLDWLLDHQAEFRWLVMERLGKDVAEQIEWTSTRLLCIHNSLCVCIVCGPGELLQERGRSLPLGLPPVSLGERLCPRLRSR